MITEAEIKAIDPLMQVFTNLNTMADNLEYSSNILASNISGSYQQYGYSSEGFFVNRLFPEIATDNLTAPSGINVNSVAFDSFNTTDELKYGNFTLGLAPSYQIKQDDLTVNLGVKSGAPKPFT